ncbi:MAG: hypothetical protein SFV81_15545 [Pirellulaceae bacterium]|nr:hypothetical protein [Pirellulaceae bacterium]
MHTSQEDTGSFLGKQRSLKRSNFNEAAGMFRNHATIAEVAERLSLATSTVQDYLVSYVQFAKLTDISPWYLPKISSALKLPFVATQSIPNWLLCDLSPSAMRFMGWWHTSRFDS